jgi:DNA modification methylase
MERRSAIVPIESLTPYDGNARRGDVELLKGSLKHHGQYRDIVVQESTGQILAGNHTWLAAKELGWADIGACFVDVDDEQARKIVLVDNRSNDVAGYDIPSLAQLLREVDDLEGTGFDDQALADVMAALSEGFSSGKDKDDAPPLLEGVEPETKLGDLYLLGPHRLLCGDSTDGGSVDRLLDGTTVELVFTDPPYNMNFDGRSGKWLAADNKRPQKVLINDNLSSDGFDDLIRGSLANAYGALCAGGSAYVFCDWRHYPQVQGIFSEFLQHKSSIIWDKTHFGMGVHYRMQYEMLLFGSNGDKPAIWTAGKNERDVWSLQRENVREYRHVTQKPVEIAERAIKNSSKEGHSVLDLFGGSGTTLVACHALGRRCYMMELDRAYCDVIVRRWEDLTGSKAERV